MMKPNRVRKKNCRDRAARSVRLACLRCYTYSAPEADFERKAAELLLRKPTQALYRTKLRVCIRKVFLGKFLSYNHLQFTQVN